MKNLKLIRLLKELFGHEPIMTEANLAGFIKQLGQSCNGQDEYKTVCVDLDGVLAIYDGYRGPYEIGNPLTIEDSKCGMSAKEFLMALNNRKLKVVIHTTRGNCEVAGWLEDHNLADLVTGCLFLC